MSTMDVTKDAPLSNTSACGGDEFSVHFLLDFLSLCESSGFIQLKLSFSQLKEKLESLWNEMFSPQSSDMTCTTATATGSDNLPSLPFVEGEEVEEGREVEVVSEKEEEEEEGRYVQEEEGRLVVEEEGVEVEEGEGEEEEGWMEENDAETDVEEEVEKNDTESDVEERQQGREVVEEEEEREELAVEEKKEEEGREGEYLNWTILTPNVSHTSVDEEEIQDGNEESSDCEEEEEVGRWTDGGVNEVRENGILTVQVNNSLSSVLEFRYTPTSQTTPDDCSSFPQPNFDDLSTRDERTTSHNDTFELVPDPSPKHTCSPASTPSPPISACSPASTPSPPISACSPAPTLSPPISACSTAPTPSPPISACSPAPTPSPPISACSPAPTPSPPISACSPAPTPSPPISACSTAPTPSPPISACSPAPTPSPPISACSPAPTPSPPCSPAPTPSSPISACSPAPTPSPPISACSPAPTPSPPISACSTAPTPSPPISACSTAPTPSPPISACSPAPTPSPPISACSPAPTPSPPCSPAPTPSSPISACIPAPTPSPPISDTLSHFQASDGTAITVSTEHHLSDRRTPPPPSQPPSSPPSERGERSTVIVLDSSDDEADSKLENLFADMRLQSTKKKVQAKIPSRKSLMAFIVSDSEVESDGEDCTVWGTHSSPQTPLRPTCKASLTPFTPYTMTPVFWQSPDRDPSTAPTSNHCIMPSETNRQPLTERNRSPQLPGGTAKAGITAVATTPSAHKLFSRHKNTMARELYTLFNRTVFSNELPADMELSWNNKMRTTAGYCRNNGTMNNRQSRIELSTKVIDSYERLKNTLIHEMCHAAVWLINGVRNGGHKRQWQAWALKSNTVHPDLDTITRCHNYDITYKYTYKCTRCDYKLGRHSKSVNLTTSRCPYCLSHLELEPRLKSDGTPAAVKLNRYAQYVKQHYAAVKLKTPNGGHKAVMERLREDYYSSRETPVLDLNDSS